MKLNHQKKESHVTEEKALNDSEINKLLKGADGWKLLNSNSRISKMFEFGDFKMAMKFVNSIAVVAEREEHHPDILILYNKITLTLWTHSVGGLSKKDFALASKVDAIEKPSK